MKLGQGLGPIYRGDTGTNPEYNSKLQGLEEKASVMEREPTIVDKMSVTANRLEDIESKLGHIHNWLYGPESTDPGECFSSEPNVLSQANRAYNSVNRIDGMLNEIHRRLALRD